MYIVLTQVTTPVIGWVCKILGWLINLVFSLLDVIGIPNIGLAIVLFTLVVYICMLPLQIKQQKFTKMNSIMQPEIQKIQNKYKGKKDQESTMRQNEEISAVYQKYGVSPTGSCLQLFIQLPILYSLYQVIYKIPGYITGVRNVFTGLADKIVSVDGYSDIISKFLTDNSISMYGIKSNMEFTKDTTIDFLYKLSPSQMESFSSISEFSGFSDLFNQVAEKAGNLNTFFNLNISDNPLSIIKAGVAQGNTAGYLMVFAAVLVPILAWFTQWINYKLIPNASGANSNGQASSMEASMKTMNTVMPVMSAVFCFTFPVGIGIYWIAGAVIRSIQQVVLNRILDKMDMDEYIKKNQEKAAKKMAKRGIDPQKINQQARMNVRNIENNKSVSGMSAEEKAEKIKKATEYYNNSEFKPGSIAAKANMVKQFDEKNKNKKK